MITMKKRKKKVILIFQILKKKLEKVSFVSFCFATSQSKILLQNGYNKMF